MSAYRKRISLDNLACSIDDIGFGNFATLLGFDDDFFAETGLFVGIDAVGDVFLEVDIFDLTADFADDNGVEGVPFADYVALLDGSTVSKKSLAP